MSRVKNGPVTKARHKRMLKLAKGYVGARSRTYKKAKEAVTHALTYAYRDRRAKKRDFRGLWIARINAACRNEEMTYSRFINGLTKAGVEVDRKMLSDLAINEPAAFSQLIKLAKENLESNAA